MTNYREEFRYFKKMMYVAGRQILEAPWVFVLSMLFGIFLNTIVHSYFNGFTNTLKLMVDHPLAMGLAP